MQFNIGTMLNDRTLPEIEIAPAIEERGSHSMSCGEHTHMPVAAKHRHAKSAELPGLYHYKVQRCIEFRESIPMNASQKAPKHPLWQERIEGEERCFDRGDRRCEDVRGACG
jgi:hypothetical protein